MKAELYWIPYQAPGNLAVMKRPAGYQWLDEELHYIKSQGVDVLVCALEHIEMEVMGLQEEKAKTQAACIEFLHFPIPDHEAPDDLSHTMMFVSELSSRLNEGLNIAIHCRQAIGRSPLLAASLMVMQGETTRKAFQLIRKGRHAIVPDVPKQYRFVQQIERMQTKKNPYENPISMFRDWASEKLGRSI